MRKTLTNSASYVWSVIMGFVCFSGKNSGYFLKQLWCYFVTETQCSPWGSNWIPGVEWLTKCTVWTGKFGMSRLSTVDNPVHPWPALERSAVADGLTSRTVKTRGTSVHKYKRSVATFSNGCLSHRPLFGARFMDLRVAQTSCLLVQAVVIQLWFA